jgi:hypothetical protein
MTTETTQKQLDELDSMLGWDFTQAAKGQFDENAVVPDGWYFMELTRVSKPYISKGQYGDKTKCTFEYTILAEADKKNQQVESEFEGGKIPAFVNIEARDPEKSTMYPMCSALLGQDAREWSQQNGQFQPSKLIGRKCWVRVTTTANDKGDMKSFLNEFKAKLPQAQFSAGSRNAVQGNKTATNQPAKAEPPF